MTQVGYGLTDLSQEVVMCSHGGDARCGDVVGCGGMEECCQ